MASPSVRRATYRLVMDFTHLCSQSSMYLQQIGTSVKMAVDLRLPANYINALYSNESMESNQKLNLFV